MAAKPSSTTSGKGQSAVEDQKHRLLAFQANCVSRSYDSLSKLKCKMGCPARLRHVAWRVPTVRRGLDAAAVPSTSRHSGSYAGLVLTRLPFL
jgi:hypothetical protein